MMRHALGAFELFALLMYAAGLGAAPPPHPAKHATYANRAEVREFIRDMAEHHGFSEHELRALFSHVRRQPEILKAIRPPASPRTRSWANYRPIFVNDRHVAEGMRFFGQNAEALARAEREYGVPQEIIVAIIGVETFYGRNMGKWRVADALATLAFDYPPRAAYFRAELETFLLFTREAGLDPLGVLGSYAGAIGIPQFMPRSYRLFAVDFDGDGVARLRSSPTDAIGSVANFLKLHGWVPGEPIAYRAAIAGADPAPLVAAGLKPSRTLADLAAAGVAFRADPAPKPGALGALIELETPDNPSEYRIGLENFYVITRYNQSSFYAAAVSDLAATLRLALGR